MSLSFIWVQSEYPKLKALSPQKLIFCQRQVRGQPPFAQGFEFLPQFRALRGKISGSDGEGRFSAARTSSRR